jgi:probable rRNA maturation factor
MPKKSRQVDVVVSVRGGPFRGCSPRTVERRARKMIAALDLGAVELSIALVDDQLIRELNRTWRGYPRATDVLAFAMREAEPVPELGIELLGDIVISIPTAKRQARHAKRPLLAELTMLLAHGLLHLLGYDHATKAEESVMTQKTGELARAASCRNGGSRPDSGDRVASRG